MEFLSGISGQHCIFRSQTRLRSRLAVTNDLAFRLQIRHPFNSRSSFSAIINGSFAGLSHAQRVVETFSRFSAPCVACSAAVCRTDVSYARVSGRPKGPCPLVAASDSAKSETLRSLIAVGLSWGQATVKPPRARKRLAAGRGQFETRWVCNAAAFII
jgi:hypothetical protein